MAPYASLTAGNVAERYKTFHAATEVECFHMRGTVAYEKEDYTSVFDVILLWWTFATLVHLYYMQSFARRRAVRNIARFFLLAVFGTACYVFYYALYSPMWYCGMLVGVPFAFWFKYSALSLLAYQSRPKGQHKWWQWNPVLGLDAYTAVLLSVGVPSAHRVVLLLTGRNEL
eukprot:3934215-Rhodomonas_salina.1